MGWRFRHAAFGASIVAAAVAAEPGAVLAQTGAAPARGPRIVAPDLIAPPPIAPSDLQRIAPRPSLDGSVIHGNDIVPARPKPKAAKLLKADPLLFKPVAEQAGVIVAAGRTVTLAGVDPLPVDEICGADAGNPWPCGMAARTAFRGFLRGRAVRCEFPKGDVPAQVVVPCRLGNRDLGEWLVANGWARAADDVYKDQAEAAEEAKRGVYGPPPRALDASLRAAAAGSSQVPGALPSGGLSILPSDSGPPREGEVDATPPPAPRAVPPAGSQTAPFGIQSAPPPPPQVE